MDTKFFIAPSPTRNGEERGRDREQRSRQQRSKRNQNTKGEREREGKGGNINGIEECSRQSVARICATQVNQSNNTQTSCPTSDGFHANKQTFSILNKKGFQLYFNCHYSLIYKNKELFLK